MQNPEQKYTEEQLWDMNQIAKDIVQANQEKQNQQEMRPLWDKFDQFLINNRPPSYQEILEFNCFALLNLVFRSKQHDKKLSVEAKAEDAVKCFQAAVNKFITEQHKTSVYIEESQNIPQNRTDLEPRQKHLVSASNILQNCLRIITKMIDKFKLSSADQETKQNALLILLPLYLKSPVEEYK